MKYAHSECLLFLSVFAPALLPEGRRDLRIRKLVITGYIAPCLSYLTCVHCSNLVRLGVTEPRRRTPLSQRGQTPSFTQTGHAPSQPLHPPVNHLIHQPTSRTVGQPRKVSPLFSDACSRSWRRVRCMGSGIALYCSTARRCTLAGQCPGPRASRWR